MSHASDARFSGGMDPNSSLPGGRRNLLRRPLRRGNIKEENVGFYFLGIDGISLLLILLTTFLTVLCVLVSWKAIEKRVKEYFITFLFLETAMVGTLCSLDLVLFYIFWELMLIPMYLLIGVWGGPRRIYAAIKFFLFTMAGSVLMLLAIFALYFQYYKATGVYTFNVLDLYHATVPGGLQ
ncbi:MAG: proton-conducting transporter membrane subunit, partial [Thermodesulfobacteriota bacterium]